MINATKVVENLVFYKIFILNVNEKLTFYEVKMLHTKYEMKSGINTSVCENEILLINRQLSKRI